MAILKQGVVGLEGFDRDSRNETMKNDEITLFGFWFGIYSRGR